MNPLRLDSADNLQTHVITTSKRCFDVKITCLLCCVFAGYAVTAAYHQERCSRRWHHCANKVVNLTLLILVTEYSSCGGSIPCLLMPWLLKSPEHQQAWYWLCRTHGMYWCYTVNFIYLGQAKYSGTPLLRPTEMVAFQKTWPVMRGKINMICKEWYMEIGQIFATLVRHPWPFQRGSTVQDTIQNMNIYIQSQKQFSILRVLINITNDKFSLWRVFPPGLIRQKY